MCWDQTGANCCCEEVIYGCLDSSAINYNVIANTPCNDNGTPNDLTGDSGLVGYWRFEEGSGTTVEDLSGEGNHGTFGAISGNTTAYPTWSTDTPQI